MKMKQCILSMLLAVCLMVWMFPVTALADDSVTVNLTWAHILEKIDDDTYGEWSSTNPPIPLWGFDPNTSTLVIYGGLTVSDTGTDTILYAVDNYGIITGGTFQNSVVNHASASIKGGMYTGSVDNSGTITGGTFQNYVSNTEDTGKITEGTFSGPVSNSNGSEITGGTFHQPVHNSVGSKIIGGTFNQLVFNGSGSEITAGTFHVGIENNGGTVAPELSKYILVSSVNNNSGSSANSSSTSDSHTHNFNWVITLEPTETTDGVWEYRCECGNVEAKQPASLYEVVIKNIINDIQNAPENGTVTIDHIFLRCLSDEIVAALSARPDVTVQIDFTDKGVSYSLTIPAGQAPTDGQEWYGYYYLGSLYGWTSVVPLA